MCQTPGHQQKEISTSLSTFHPQESVESNEVVPQPPFFIFLITTFLFFPLNYSTELVTVGEAILLFSFQGIFPFTCMLGQCVKDFKVLFALTCQNKVTSTNTVADALFHVAWVF